ncbi:MAG: molybdenum ABC transporter ATP-binding protein [Gammaproteobacteria bacterium]
MTDIDADLRLTRGEFNLAAQFQAPGYGITALFGASGAGKSLLLRSVAGLESAVQGQLHVAGECWQDSSRGWFLPAHRRPIGYVFQEASLFAHLSVRGNLEYGYKRVAPKARTVAWDQAIELLGIAALLQRQPTFLSGGERQRVAIARALLTGPRLLLMDEPLAALDQASKAEILPYFARLSAALAIPVLYVTHASDEVARLADYLVLLARGAVVAQGALTEMLTRLDLPIAHGDSAEAVLNAQVAEHDTGYQLTYLECASGRFAIPQIDAPIGSSARLRIAARDVSLTLAPPQGTSILNILPVRLIAISDDRPGQVMLALDANGARLLARITRKSLAQLHLEVGQALYAQIKSVALAG